jgi:hypothetical protein
MGGRYRIDLGGDLNDEKMNKIIIYPGLRWLPNNHFTCNNQPKAGANNRGELGEEARLSGSMGGGCKSIVLATIEAGV